MDSVGCCGTIADWNVCGIGSSTRALISSGITSIREGNGKISDTSMLRRNKYFLYHRCLESMKLRC